MNKIGVIGGRDSVLGFRALGLDTCIAENGEQAKAALHRMAKENYAIIYITEHLAAQIPAEIERRREDVSPAVILIPGHPLPAARQGSCRRHPSPRRGIKNRNFTKNHAHPIDIADGVCYISAQVNTANR